MPVSMRDVARHAKVSVGTVSKCLRGVVTIPEHTRAAVSAVAQRMGYKPHPYVSALMRSRSQRKGPVGPRPTLAYVSAFPTAEEWKRVRFFKALFDGAVARAARRGYALQHFWLFRDGMTNQRFSQVLRARGVRGILFNPVPSGEFHCELNWPDFSTVAHGLSISTPVFHRTSNDHFQSMMLAMQQCAAHGYRNPGFALEKHISRRLEYRWESAFATAHEKFRFPRLTKPLLQDAWNAPELGRWVRREKPDVVITLMLEEQLEELAAAGLRIPEELGLISLSVDHPGSVLAGIDQNPRHMGEVAVDKLIELVEKNETGIPSDPITLTIEGRWNAGRTLRPAPAVIPPRPRTRSVAQKVPRTPSV